MCKRRLPRYTRPCHRAMPPLLASATSYEENLVRELVHLLKYEGIKTAAEPLGSILASYLRRMAENINLDLCRYIIIPVPLHPKREKRRGFNQSILIAESCVRLLKSSGISFQEPGIETATLFKKRYTPPQVTLSDFTARAKNVKGSFVVRAPEKVHGKNILLLDDVFTSGATMGEAARALYSACAKKVIGLTVART